MEKITIHCDIYHRFEKVARLDIENGNLDKYTVYTNNRLKCPCPEDTSFQNILAMLASRVICRERCDKLLLDYFGLSDYNVYDILRKTHGVDSDDFIWFKFDGEEVTWENVYIRR